MTMFALKIPPGVVRQGTEYGSKGRYYDAYLVRWNIDGTLKPVGGWRLRSDDTVEGLARALLAWKDNSGVTWLGIGTHTGLFVQNRSGDVYDITPTGFTEGRADAVAAGGYGDGDYGVGTYGTPRPDSSSVQEATQWTLDTFGQYLVAVSPEDGKLYIWQLDTDTPAAQIDNSPTCRAVVVTPEGFIFALGTTDPRTLGWCDQRNPTLWAPDATNQAGDFPLQTQGALMLGKAIKGATLIWTDLDLWSATFVGGTLVYSFERVGTACGAISRQCVAIVDNQAFWMGQDRFWFFNGYAQELPCDVLDYVFSDFNRLQASKVYAVRNSANSEIEFYYCSASSNEIDRCVIFNYSGNYWNIGRAPRTCGTDRGVFSYPIYVADDGAIYEHEVGLSYDGAVPYAEAGPVEIGDGDSVMRCNALVPDEKTSGQVTATFFVRFAPNGTETTFGPYALAEKADVRFEAREARLRISGAVLSDWRVGTPRLDILSGGRRI
jgi:hypothetical protein